MNWDSLIVIARLTLTGVGLVWLGRLLRTARIYASWRAFVFYGVAWLAFPGLCLLQLRLFGLPALPLLSLLFEVVFLAGVAGSLLEHVRADRRRYRDSRRLLEQHRQASALSRRRTHALETLAAITASLVANLELPQVLQDVVDHALRLAAAEAVAVYLVDADTGQLRSQGVSAVASRASAAELPAPRPAGLTAQVARDGQAVFVEATAAHPLFTDPARASLGALASVPLKVNGVVVGVLNAAYQRPHAFDEDARRTLLALADISALAIHNAAHHDHLARLAVTDDLTGLPNRRRFVEALRAEVQRARRYGRCLSLILLDLDGLKAVNDRHGHAAGDAVLRGVAQALRAATRETDLPARLSGDEFAVLLPETESAAAQYIARRIQAEVAALQVAVEGGLAGVTVSLGLVSAEGAGLPDVPHFMRLADAALYEAKAAGRNTFVVSSGADERETPRAPRPLTTL